MDTLEKKFHKYFAEHREREKLVETLSLSASPEDIEKWEAERQRFEEERISDPSVADKFFKQDLTQGLCVPPILPAAA